MAIITAVQSGNQVTVYGENGRYLFARSGTLMGFTGDSVSIQVGNQVTVYGETGNYKFSRSC